jgi:hypothetical protein
MEIDLNAIALACSESLKLLLENVLMKDVHVLWKD